MVSVNVTCHLHLASVMESQFILSWQLKFEREQRLKQIFDLIN